MEPRRSRRSLLSSAATITRRHASFRIGSHLLVVVVCLLLGSDGVRCRPSNTPPPPPSAAVAPASSYRLGSYVHHDDAAVDTSAVSITTPRPLASAAAALVRSLPGRLKALDIVSLLPRLFRLVIFTVHTYDAAMATLDDRWTAERVPEKMFGKGRGIWHRSELAVVQRRTRQASVMREYVGVGYSPRMVWLFGLMLRGIVHCTALPKVFQPPLGWGAGSVLAAKFAHREWIPVIMLGWFGSGPYWTTLFGVTGPPGGPDFDGVPITIKGARF